jgi:hypothetical protein
VLTITNSGGGTLNISSIASDNAAFTPDLVSATVAAGNSVGVTITFSPTAAGDYSGNLIITSDAASSPDTVKLTGTGSPTSGGPDTFGYTWVNSFDAAGPTFDWIDTTGALDRVIDGDDVRGEITLPFWFYFYGNWYNNLWLTTNGWAGFGDDPGSSYYSNSTIPSTSGPENMIAAFWDDLKIGQSTYGTDYGGGSIYTKTVGTAPNRQFVIIWQDVARSYPYSDLGTFEIILYEGSNNIVIQYLDVEFGSSSYDNGQSATVGIENAAGDDGLLYEYNGDPQLVYNNLAIEFIAPAAPEASVAPILISEIVVTPTGGEFIEIYNPNSDPVDLSDFYLTDATYASGGTYYYNIVTGDNYGGGGFGDFHARFPAGATIYSGEYQTIALNGDADFYDQYGVYPTYEIDQAEHASGTSDDIPDMREAVLYSIFGSDSTNNPGLTNGDEVVILYHWDGTTDLVHDSDYLLYDDAGYVPNEAVDKTGVSIDGPDADTDSSTYAADTPISDQHFGESPGYGFSLHRVDYTEGNETTTGGNGLGGSDETSEDTDVTFAISFPTPGGPADLDIYEPNNSLSEAAPIAPNDTLYGLKIDPVDDLDFFSFEAQRLETVTIDMFISGYSSLDGEVALFDADSTKLISSDVGFSGGDEQILDFEIPADGTYYIVAGYWGDVARASTGEYALGLSVTPAPPTPTLDLDYSALWFIPAEIGDTLVEQSFVIGSNSGAATLGIDSIVTTNPDFSVTLATGDLRADSIASGADILVDLSFTPTAFGMTSSAVIFYTNALSSPDTLWLYGEAGVYVEGFESGEIPFNWTVYDNDGDGYDWYAYYTTSYAHTGFYSARVHWNSDGNDDWLITPKLTPAAGDSLIFYARSQSSYWLEDMEVRLSTTGVDTADFTTLLGSYTQLPNSYTRFAFDLSPYAGSDIYIAVVCVSVDQYYLHVDDFLLPGRWLSSTPEVILSTDLIDFGMVIPTYTANVVVTVTNGGGVDLDITDIAVVGDPAFSVDVTSATLAPFEALEIPVSFTPVEGGDYAADLVLTSNAASSPDTVVLVGAAAPTAGGPDVSGYTWRNSIDPLGPTYDWIDTTGATAIFPNALGDDYRVQVYLPFSFWFYGSWVDSVVITTNGWVGFGPWDAYTSSFWTNDPIPDPDNPNYLAAPLWDDWKAASAYGSYHGVLYYKTVGEAPNRKFALIWWEVVRSSSDDDYYSFELVLDEATNNLIFQYYDVVGSSDNANYGVGATIGIENPEGVDGLEYAYNGDPQAVADGLAIEFYAPATGSVSGTVTDASTGEPLADVLVEVNGNVTTTGADGTYFIDYIAPGTREVSFTADGYQPAFFAILVNAGETTVQDAALIPATLDVIYYSGFEPGDDMGWTFTGGTNPFEATNGFMYTGGGDTVYVDPVQGETFMACTPNPLGYDNDEFSWWMNLTDTQMDLTGYASAHLTLRMYYMTEENWDFVILLANQPSVDGDVYYYVDVNGDGIGDGNDMFSGNSGGWIEVTADLTPWAGLPDVEIAVLFDSDGSVNGASGAGFGVAIDSVVVTASGTFLAPPMNLTAQSFIDDQIPLSWEAPGGGTRAFTTRSVQLEQREVTDAREGDRNRLQRIEAEVTRTLDFGEADVRRDLVSYNVFRSEIGEPWELIGNTTETNFTDASVINYAEYAYFVSAVYDEGESMGSNVVVAGAGAVVDVSLEAAGSDFEVEVGTLPEGWTNINMGEIDWYVTDSASATNDIPDHSLFAYFDDDDPGSGVVGFSFLTSPFIDLSGAFRAALNMDYYFRGGYGSSLSVWGRVGYDDWIYLADLPATYPDWADSVWVDISPVAGHEHVRIAILYDDGGGWAWYAGVDNISLHTFPGPVNLTATPGVGEITLTWMDPGRAALQLSRDHTMETERHVAKALPAEAEDPSSERTDCFNHITSNYYYWGWDSVGGPASVFAFPPGPMPLESMSFDLYLPSASIYSDTTLPVEVLVAEADVFGTTVDTIFHSIEMVPTSAGNWTYTVALSDTFWATEDNFLKATFHPMTLIDDYPFGDGNYYYGPFPRSDDGSAPTFLSGFDSAGVFFPDVYNFNIEVCGTPTPPPLAYNVYRDEMLLATGVMDHTFVDENVPALEEHCYFVTASLPRPGPGGITVFLESDSSNHACAQVANQPPSSFMLVSPANGDTIVITPDNIGNSLLFAWTPAMDPDGHLVTYIWTGDSPELGLEELDTTATAFFVTYQEIYDAMYEANAQITTATWDVVATDGIDETPSSNGPFTVTFDVTALSVDEGPAVPEVFALHQNFPNPFNPVTTIAYDIPEVSEVRIEVYNVMGQKIRTLVNRRHEPGYYRVRWNGTNDYGAPVASGMYFYRIQAKDFVRVRKLVLIK